MKLTDVLAAYLKKNSVNAVFGLQGGAVVHIFDSIEKIGLDVTYVHHEQAAGLAATANAKAAEGLGCAVVTTGPGCTNAMTGLLAAWQDSIPVIFISGQVRLDHLSYGKKVRQVGTQEVNIVDVVRPISKYAVVLKSKEMFVPELEKAISIAISGRPGPVWLDIPLNLQWEDIEFKKEKIKKIEAAQENKDNLRKFEKLFSLIQKSEQPLFILGYGLRLSGKYKKLVSFLKKNNFKFVTSWTAGDLVETANELNLGIIGMRGQAGANKAVFNSDLLVCMGSHLPIPQTTTLTDNYAPKAKKVIINIDRDQLKNLNIRFDLKIHSNLVDVIDFLVTKKFAKRKISYLSNLKKLNWYNPVKENLPNANSFFRKVSAKMDKDCCFVVDGGGTALYAGFQSVVIKDRQRIICSSAISAMGTGLAEVLGAYKSKKFKKIVCIIGDGSFLMNIQDIQCLKAEGIPVLVIVVNNNGYLAIRHTQSQFLKGKLYGTHPDWGLKMPSIEKLSKAFELNYLLVDKEINVDKAIKQISECELPLVCELVVSDNSKELFTQGYRDNQDGTFSPLPLSEMIGE